jgi:hypothetical protein
MYVHPANQNKAQDIRSMYYCVGVCVCVCVPFEASVRANSLRNLTTHSSGVVVTFTGPNNICVGNRNSLNLLLYERAVKRGYCACQHTMLLRSTRMTTRTTSCRGKLYDGAPLLKPLVVCCRREFFATFKARYVYCLFFFVLANTIYLT